MIIPILENIITANARTKEFFFLSLFILYFVLRPKGLWANL